MILMNGQSCSHEKWGPSKCSNYAPYGQDSSHSNFTDAIDVLNDHHDRRCISDVIRLRYSTGVGNDTTFACQVSNETQTSFDFNQNEKEKRRTKSSKNELVLLLTLKTRGVKVRGKGKCSI